MGGKLTARGIRWAILERKKGELSTGVIARHLGVTSRWIRELPTKYGGIPSKDIRIKSPGRRSIPISSQERVIVRKTKEQYGSGQYH
ncbi:MAG: hypothetical protein M1321_00655 [Candidatus Marsarchaeota archaeon]|jgi:hypothetical protein|nr:hypothetical protein [Candidatus Marsarchaeota archaeon]